MDLSMYAIVIGALSCLMYIILGGFSIAALVYLVEGNDNSDKDVTTLITIGCLVLIFHLLMVLISGLMVLGVKKRRSDLMSPWLFLTVAGIGCSILNLLIDGYKEKARQIIISVIYILVDIAIWYPIYKLWKELRSGGGGDYQPIINQQTPRQPLAEQQPPPNYAATAGGYQGSYPIASQAE